MSSKRPITMLAVLMLTCGCVKDPIQQEARRILDLPELERRGALSRLSPSQQLDVDMYAVTSVEPPDSLAVDLAANWKSILPLVPSRMDSEVNDRKLLEYVGILFAISATQCSLTKHREVFAATARNIPKFQHSSFKRNAEDQLKEISGEHQNLPPCQ